MTTDILNQIQKNIEREQKIKKNVSLFIIEKKLTEYKIDKIIPDSLPVEAYYGTIYLIKGSTIFQITSEPELDLIVDPFENWRSLFNDRIMKYKSIVYVHNVFIGDINEFSNPKQFVDMDDMISYELQKTHGFIMVLVKNKFKIYVVDKNKIDIDVNVLNELS